MPVPVLRNSKKGMVCSVQLKGYSWASWFRVLGSWLQKSVRRGEGSMSSLGLTITYLVALAVRVCCVKGRSLPLPHSMGVLASLA